MDLNTLRIALMGISVYRGVCKKPVMMQVAALLDALAAGQGELAVKHYTEVFYQLHQEGCAGLNGWLEEKLKDSEESYPLLVERGECDFALEEAARRDVENFAQLAELDCEVLIGAMQSLLPQDYHPMLAGLPQWESGVTIDFDCLTQFYRDNGTGLFARYRAFLWEDGELFPIANPDAPEKHELLGYEQQREIVIANTHAMMQGHTVNNVLLYGDSGTGKSATVKSLLAVDGLEDLRIIELQKDGLGDMSALIRRLRDRRQKFILFIDDLAFDQDDRTYSLLKTILEGGLEPRPANVAIYATSNRRNLVRQTFSERAGEEVDTFETISEKTALAERFGLRIPYLTMNKVSYLALVEHLAKQAGIDMPKDQLHAQAMTWEIRHAGRTPRVARQFIASLRP